MYQNTQVSETKEFRRSYFRETENLTEFGSITFSVWCYRGSEVNPKWKDIDTGKVFFFVDLIILAFQDYLTFWILYFLVDNYTKLCTIEADLSFLPLPAQTKSLGVGTFFRLDYELALLFGLTEMKAQVVYKDRVSNKKNFVVYCKFI